MHPSLLVDLFRFQQKKKKKKNKKKSREKTEKNNINKPTNEIPHVYSKVEAVACFPRFRYIYRGYVYMYEQFYCVCVMRIEA